MAKPKALIPLLLLFPIFFATPKAQAASEFKTSYSTTYTVAETGDASVTQNVTIENLTSRYFVSQYKFTIGSDELANVKAWDTTGALAPEVEKKDGETVITIKFKAREFGVGKKLNFGISYKFPNLAQKNGLLWELNLPKLSGLEEISTYALTVAVPKSSGPLLYSFPNPISTGDKGDKQTINFDKAGLSQGAPRLAFGQFQLYALSLTYHLKNPSVTLGYTEITLPPDIMGYQKIIQKSLFPHPDSIRVDGDGNYLARYNLGPFEKRDVVWEGFTALYYPSRNFSKAGQSEIPTDLTQKYTQSQEYWETQAVEIKAQAAKLTDPSRGVAENARALYNFVSQNLSYDYARLEGGELTRLGALAALEQKNKAVCMEYTDLFIALSRAASIPTREVNGFAYTTDEADRPLSLRIEGGDVLHAWPQVYIPQTGWVMVDPTWGSTSGSNYFSAFDLSHIVFVVKGESSEYPLPAGSYKTNPDQKDVEVSFGSETEIAEEEPALEIQIDFPVYAISPFATAATIKIRNTGKVSAFNARLGITNVLLTLDREEFELGTIPPGAEVVKEATLTPENALTRGEEKISVTLAAEDFSGNELSFEQEATKNIRPIYLPLTLPEFIVAGVALASIVFGRKVLLTRLLKK
ncbi:hypothetical protein GTO10_05615 [Candidatus Saccharibacteria bacterium]|nr:hypothetical protein [Candidatus Saccharibacteria bacterium]